MTQEEIAKEVMKLKELLWLRHGCPMYALYGDDGEMQCGRCLIDFKRSSAAAIEEIFYKLNVPLVLKVKLSELPTASVFEEDDDL